MAATRLSLSLRLGLGRWIGSEGYRSLLNRAMQVTVVSHPVLHELSIVERDPGVFPIHGERAAPDNEVAIGMQVLVTTLIEMLGGIIGEEMAVRLVEQAGTDNSRDARNSGPEREADD